MLLAVVVTHHGSVETIVACIVVVIHIDELMAVMVVMHVSAHICVIMCQVQRCGMVVVMRPVVPVPG